MVNDGQLTCSATGPAARRSSQVQPSRRISVDVPRTRPPPGAVTLCVMPLARVTGISSESGLIAIAVLTAGLTSPISRMSTLPATEPISVSPRTLLASMKPG